MEEVVEHAPLGRLLGHALTASSVGVAGSFLLVQTVEGGHEARTLCVVSMKLCCRNLRAGRNIRGDGCRSR